MVGRKNDGKFRRKKMQKNGELRVSFHAWKICVYGVFWKSFYNDDLQTEIKVPTPQM